VGDPYCEPDANGRIACPRCANITALRAAEARVVETAMRRNEAACHSEGDGAEFYAADDEFDAACAALRQVRGEGKETR
jgi:hypothetical protein